MNSHASPDPTATVGTQLDAPTPSERVVTAVANVLETPPSELTPPLFSVVDPEALDTLVESLDADATLAAGSAGRVEFTYCGLSVTVTADGRALVSEPADESISG